MNARPCAEVPRAPLAGGRLALLPHSPGQIDELLEAVLESVAEISPWMGWCHPGYGREDCEAWVNAQPSAWARGDGFEFVIVESRTARVVGACGLNQFNHPNRFANLGYWIRTSRRGNGFAPEAAWILADFGFRTLGLVRIEIVAAKENVASQRAAEKAGALREGLLRNRLVVGDTVQDAFLFSMTPDQR
jgi:RimJ/RimL family protein N-acetyltransferase